MKLKPASITTYKRGASDFSAQIAKMKADGAISSCWARSCARRSVPSPRQRSSAGTSPSWARRRPTFPTRSRSARTWSKASTPPAPFETPYADTAKGKVKDWVEAYKKMFGTDANTQSVIGYNAVMTFAHYAKLAGKDLTGQKMLDALESGDPYLDIFNSPPSKFSKTNHLANTITQVQQVEKRPLDRHQGRPGLLAPGSATHAKPGRATVRVFH